MEDRKVLMVGNSRDKWLYSVGGSIQFGETIEEAVVREIFEENGYKLSVNRLTFIHEHFFRGSIGSNKGKSIMK